MAPAEAAGEHEALDHLHDTLHPALDRVIEEHPAEEPQKVDRIVFGVTAAIAVGFVLWGFLSTSTLSSASTAGAMLALSRDPEQFARVKADRSLLAGIVEEAIRWTTPVQHFMRTAAVDTDIAGVPIAAGDWLMLNYVAANHDPAQFDNPRKFDAARSPNRHLAFGAGAHQCLGLHLARLEMRILFEALLDRIEAVEPAGEAKRASSTFVGGLKTLPLRIRTG